MYDREGNLTKEFAEQRSGKAEDVDFVDTTYHNDNYRFTLTFPDHWIEKYAAIESEPGSSMNTCVTFYQRSSYDASDIDMKMGRLFSVAVYTSREWNRVKGDITSMTESLGEMKYKDLVFYFAAPTDVQFDPDNKETTSEYRAMSGDIPDIVRTMSFEE